MTLIKVIPEVFIPGVLLLADAKIIHRPIMISIPGIKPINDEKTVRLGI